MRSPFFILAFLCSSVCMAQTSDTVSMSSGNIIATRLPSKPINYKDSGYLVIELYKNNYLISLKEDVLKTANISAIDRFISSHMSKIDKEKIYVQGYPGALYERFKALRTVLKKYEFYRFRIEAD